MQHEARLQLVISSLENRPFAGADDGAGNSADVGNVERGADGRVQPPSVATGEGTGNNLGGAEAADRGATDGGVACAAAGGLGRGIERFNEETGVAGGEVGVRRGTHGDQISGKRRGGKPVGGEEGG